MTRVFNNPKNFMMEYKAVPAKFNFGEKSGHKKKRKRKTHPTRLSLRTTRPSSYRTSFWVHLNTPKTHKNSFGIAFEDPLIRNGRMYGINALWLTPTGTKTTTTPSDQYVVEGLVAGGETTDSYYITEMNAYSDNASILLLTNGDGVNVVLLKPVEQVFEGYKKSQIAAVWPTKKDKAKLSSPTIRQIADRISRTNSGTGVPVCQAMLLTTFQSAATALRAKKPLKGVSKVNLNLTRIKTLINNFEVIYQRWISRDGNNAHMYHAQRTLVIEELAEYVRAGELARYDAALAVLTSDTTNIDTAAFKMAAEKGVTTSSSSSSSVADSQLSNSQLMNELKLDRLIGCVNAVSGPLMCLDVSSPQKTLCKMMIKKSAFMDWIGPESVPSLDAMLKSCGSDTGSSNGNMRNIMQNASENTWYGILCCIVLCFQSGIDCSGIAGEKNEKGTKNKISVFDREKHLGKVKRHTAVPVTTGNTVKRTFKVSFKSVCRGSKHIIKAWDVIFKELKEFADKDFWTDSNIKDTFDKLQITIQAGGSLLSETKKWTKRDERNAKLSELKWLFILYYEGLQTSEPTLNNFLTTLMTPLGSW